MLELHEQQDLHQHNEAVLAEIDKNTAAIMKMRVAEYIQRQ